MIFTVNISGTSSELNFEARQALNLINTGNNTISFIVLLGH